MDYSLEIIINYGRKLMEHFHPDYISYLQKMKDHFNGVDYKKLRASWQSIRIDFGLIESLGFDELIFVEKLRNIEQQEEKLNIINDEITKTELYIQTASDLKEELNEIDNLNEAIRILELYYGFDPFDSELYQIANYLLNVKDPNKTWINLTSILDQLLIYKRHMRTLFNYPQSGALEKSIFTDSKSFKSVGLKINWNGKKKDFAFLIGKLKQKGFIDESYKAILENFSVRSDNGEELTANQLKDLSSKSKNNPDYYPTEKMQTLFD